MRGSGCNSGPAEVDAVVAHRGHNADDCRGFVENERGERNGGSRH